jgi:hypothetical protein
MVVAFVGRRLLAELDRFLRTPLDAGQALFAAMLPHRFARFQDDILCRTYFDTDAAGVAFVINPEILVQLMDLLECHFVDRGKNDPLPQWALFDGTGFACGDTGSGCGYFGAGAIDAYVLASALSSGSLSHCFHCIIKKNENRLPF